MTERVEEIRRLHAGLKAAGCQEVPLYWIDDLLAALAQAEREREEFKEAFREQSAFTEELTQKWDAARAEVERLKEESERFAKGVTDFQKWNEELVRRVYQDEAALTRVRAALGITTDGLRELERHFSDTAYPVSTMEHELVLMSPLQKIQDVLKRAALEGAALEGRRCSH